MDLLTVLLVIAGLVGLGIILYFAFVVYAFKDLNKSREQARKEFDEKWRKGNDRRTL